MASAAFVLGELLRGKEPDVLRAGQENQRVVGGEVEVAEARALRPRAAVRSTGRRAWQATSAPFSSHLPRHHHGRAWQLAST